MGICIAVVVKLRVLCYEKANRGIGMVAEEGDDSAPLKWGCGIFILVVVLPALISGKDNSDIFLAGLFCFICGIVYVEQKKKR